MSAEANYERPKQWERTDRLYCPIEYKMGIGLQRLYEGPLVVLNQETQRVNFDRTIHNYMRHFPVGWIFTTFSIQQLYRDHGIVNEIDYREIKKYVPRRVEHLYGEYWYSAVKKSSRVGILYMTWQIPERQRTSHLRGALVGIE